MESRASRVVEKLVVRAMRGDSKIAHLLVALANKESDAMEALQYEPLRSQALAWEAEPQWQEEVDPERAETGTGSREPE
jgi:hypothetical protein